MLMREIKKAVKAVKKYNETKKITEEMRRCYEEFKEIEKRSNTMNKYLLVIEHEDFWRATETILNSNGIFFVKKNPTMYKVYVKKGLKDRLMDTYKFMSFIKYEVE